MLRRAVVAAESREQQLGGSPPQRGWILRDDRHSGLEQVRDQEVIEADQRHAMLKSVLSKGTDSAKGDEVLAREEGCWGTCRTKQVKRRALRRFDGLEVLTHKLRVVWDPRRRQAFDVAHVALGRGPDRAQVAEERNAPMTVGRQVRNGLPRPAAIVRGHAVCHEMSGRTVDEDYRGTHPPSLGWQAAVVATRGHDNEAVDLMGQERSQQLLLSLRVCVAAAC